MNLKIGANNSLQVFYIPSYTCLQTWTTISLFEYPKTALLLKGAAFNIDLACLVNKGHSSISFILLTFLLLSNIQYYFGCPIPVTISKAVHNNRHPFQSSQAIPTGFLIRQKDCIACLQVNQVLSSFLLTCHHYRCQVERSWMTSSEAFLAAHPIPPLWRSCSEMTALNGISTTIPIIKQITRLPKMSHLKASAEFGPTKLHWPWSALIKLLGVEPLGLIR